MKGQSNPEIAGSPRSYLGSALGRILLCVRAIVKARGVILTYQPPFANLNTSKYYLEIRHAKGTSIMRGKQLTRQRCPQQEAVGTCGKAQTMMFNRSSHLAGRKADSSRGSFGQREGWNNGAELYGHLRCCHTLGRVGSVLSQAEGTPSGGHKAGISANADMRNDKGGNLCRKTHRFLSNSDQWGQALTSRQWGPTRQGSHMWQTADIPTTIMTCDWTKAQRVLAADLLGPKVQAREGKNQGTCSSQLEIPLPVSHTGEVAWCHTRKASQVRDGAWITDQT